MKFKCLESTNVITEMCKDYLQRNASLVGFTYIRGSADGSRALLTTVPDLIENSSVLKNYKSAICYTTTELPRYFLFSDMIHCGSLRSPVYQEEQQLQLQRYNIKDELVINVQYDGKYAEHYGFYYNSDRNITATLILDEIDKFSQFKAAFLQKAHKQICDAINHPIVPAWIETTSKQPQLPSKPLSKREIEISQLIASGLSAKEIAKKLTISYRTIEKHVENIKIKLNIQNRVELIRYLIELDVKV